MQNQNHSQSTSLQIVQKIESQSKNVDLAKFKVQCFIQSGEGMLKEALLEDVNHSKWRVYSDEGPYMNGADTAPSPLAFFSAGMAFAFVEQMLLLAKEQNIIIQDYRITLDNYYTIKGSALQGDMISSGMPAELKIEIKSNGKPEILEKLIEKAKRRNVVFDYLDEILVNEYSLHHNGNEILDHDLTHLSESILLKPGEYEKEEEGDEALIQQLISKEEQVKTLSNVEGGSGSALQETQQRLLHIRASTKPYENEIAQTQIQIFRPLGSTFRFLCDISGMQNKNLRTPSPVALASLGIGFCFLTQTARYSKIKNYKLDNYSIHQSTSFTMEEEDADVMPIKTSAFINSTESDDTAKEIMHMSEQTCFLQGVMRGIYDVRTSKVLT